MLRRALRYTCIALLLTGATSSVSHAAHPEELKSALKRKPATSQSARINSVKKASPAQVAAKRKQAVTPSKAKPKSVVYKLRGNSSVKTVKKSKSKKVWAPETLLPSPHIVLPSNFITEIASPIDTRLEKAYVQKLSPSSVTIPRMPDFRTSYRGRVAGITDNRDFIQYSINPQLQEYAKLLVSKVQAAHVAVVAMEPSTGRILAIADKSSTIRSLALHSGFPAASLIKVVTSAAAIEHTTMQPDTEIAFRGGTYELSPANYNPRPTSDRRIMSVSEALGKSCNPVFSRVALLFLNPALLRFQTASFGFNADLNLQVPLTPSRATIPNEDFDFGRTAAGFGDVFISPVHAAALMSAVANHGKLPQPSLVDQIISDTGDTLYRFKPGMIKQSVNAETARTLMKMMTFTTTMGTSRREFLGKVPWEVAAKTGTLKGTNPVGLNNWFIGAAPYNDPQIAVSVIVVNPSGVSSKASHLARLLLEKYLG